MKTLYRCLLTESDEVEQIVKAAEEIAATYDSLEASTREEAGGLVTILTASEIAWTFLRSRPLASRDRATLAPYGPFTHEVLFEVCDRTPESDGLAWGALVAVNTYSPCWVWLSRETYDGREIGSIAPRRPASFSDGTQGSVLRPEEMHVLIGG